MASSSGFSLQAMSNYNFNDMKNLSRSCDVASSTVRIRLGFLRKVYGIVSVQLLLTTLVGAAFVTSESINYYLANTWLGLFLVIGLGIVSIGMAVGMTESTRRIFPANYIWLALFTLCESLLVGTIVTYYTLESVVMIFGATCVLTIALTIYALQSRYDFSSWGTSLFAVLLNLTAMTCLNIFMGNGLLHLCLTVFGTVFFSLYIVFDVFAIMKKLPAEEYILASVCLYLDIINLFVNLLRIFGKSRDD